MKKLLTVLCLACALTLVANAQDASTKPKHEATPEQKAERKALLEKYDTNKDGKLDKEERAKMTPEDKAKMGKRGPKADKPAGETK